MCILNYVNGVWSIEPNQKAIKFWLYLFLIFVVHLIFGFALVIFKSLILGLGEMSSSMFLLYAIIGFHFRPLLFYILINCIIQVIWICDLGYFIQQGKHIGGENLRDFIPWVILILFYFINIYFAFNAYWEYKALYCE